MAWRTGPALLRFGQWVRDLTVGPQLIAFVPAASLAAFWFGGEGALIAFALAAPIALSFLGVGQSMPRVMARVEEDEADRLTGLAPAKAVTTRLDQILADAADPRCKTAALAIEIDEYTALTERHGHAAAEEILRVQAVRIAGALREEDTVSRIDGPLFAVALSPTPRLDLETLVQMAARLQRIVAEPVGVDRATIYVTASVGFCLSARAPEPTGASLREAARIALDTAKVGGGSAIRA